MPNISPKEISLNASKINVLALKGGGKEISPAQGVLGLGIDCAADVGDIGMGVLSDGTPYLNQRGLGALCGVQNAHIGTISSQWSELDEKPRIKTIKGILAKAGYYADAAHVEINTPAVRIFAIRLRSVWRFSSITRSMPGLIASRKPGIISASWPALSSGR
jgi:hypothetical protein